MQTIIVGIKSQNRWDEFLAKPQHQETIDMAVKYFGKDFTFGNADKLAEHLKSEVFPLIEKQYRTLPTKLAIGHSLGGTFVTYCNVAYPQLFDATISISPNLVFDKQSMLEKIEKFRNTEQSFNAYNFIAFGRKDSYETNFYPGTQKAIALFEKQIPSGLMFAYIEFDDANHSSILPHGITAGLSDYYNKIFLTGTNLTAYYDSLIAGKHITLNADEANYLAYNCHNQDKTDDAITITAWAINKLPDDYSLHGSMGEFQEKKKNKPEAAKYYQKAITLLKKKKASLDSKAFTEKLDYYNNNLKRVSGK